MKRVIRYRNRALGRRVWTYTQTRYTLKVKKGGPEMVQSPFFPMASLTIGAESEMAPVWNPL